MNIKSQQLSCVTIVDVPIKLIFWTNNHSRNVSKSLFTEFTIDIIIIISLLPIYGLIFPEDQLRASRFFTRLYICFFYVHHFFHSSFLAIHRSLLWKMTLNYGSVKPMTAKRSKCKQIHHKRKGKGTIEKLTWPAPRSRCSISRLSQPSICKLNHQRSSDGSTCSALRAFAFGLCSPNSLTVSCCLLIWPSHGQP